MNVKSLTRLAQIKVTPDASVETVWKLLARRDISLVPVVSKDHTLLGVIGEDDIMQYLFDKHRHALKPKTRKKRS